MISPHPPLAGECSEVLWCQDLMRPPLWRGRQKQEKRPEKRAKASNHVCRTLAREAHTGGFRRNQKTDK